MKHCGPECYECVICKGKKVCCSCDWNNGYHACVKRKRDEKDSDKDKSIKADRSSSVWMDSKKIKEKR